MSAATGPCVPLLVARLLTLFAVCVCRPQIVADYLGLLYNKDSVISHLLSKKKFPKHLRHIKGLKVRAAWRFRAVAAPDPLDPSADTAHGFALHCRA